MTRRTVDRALLERVLRAAGVSLLGAGQAACFGDADPPDAGLAMRDAASGAGGLGGLGGTSGFGFGGIPAIGGCGGVGTAGGMPPIEPFDAGACPQAADPETGLPGLGERPECKATTDSFNFASVVCVRAPEAGDEGGIPSCSDARPHDACLLRLFSCGLATQGERVLCGPEANANGDCCYVVEGGCPVGRPFVVNGAARLAQLAAGAQWSERLAPSLEGLSPTLRLALAEAWRQDGLSEHASVASFSRFALQLLAQGAPADLVDGALAAARDEARHARLCLGLSAAYAGETLSPGALRTDDALSAGTSRLHVALSLATEGCIAETISAQLVAAARDRATDPVVREALTSIARDEAEHVELAWKALAWLVRSGDVPELNTALAQVFAEAHRHVGFGARTNRDVPGSLLADHGYLPIAQRREIAEQTLRSVVLPAARALLETTAVASLALHGSRAVC